MKNLFLTSLFTLFLFACSKDKSTIPPVIQQSCGPDKNLEGLWISDSIRDLLVDSNSTVLWDYKIISTFPQDYQMFDFFCINNTPTFFGEIYQNSIPSTTHDTSNYQLFGKAIYYAHSSITDTSQMAIKYIEYLTQKKLVIRWSSVNPTSHNRQDVYYYMRK